MNLEGRKILVNQPIGQLTRLLNNPEEYRQIMPEEVNKFEPQEDGFKFAIKGIPEIGLKIDEVKENEYIRLKSANPSLDFHLTGTMRAINENQTECQLLFEGKFNPFMRMMVEKPLQSFINALTDKIERL